MEKHLNCQDRCQIRENKGYRSCWETGHECAEVHAAGVRERDKAARMILRLAAIVSAVPPAVFAGWASKPYEAAKEGEALASELTNHIAARQESGQGFIWCDNCESIQPLKLAPMHGTNVTGEFAEPVDLLCAECRFIIGTTYGKRIPR